MSAALMNVRRAQHVSDWTSRAHRPDFCGNHQPAQGVSFEPLSMMPWPPIGAYHSTAARPSADERQGAYFIELLSQHLRRIDSRIGKCRTAMADAQAAGDAENFRGFRRLLKIEQQERSTVEDLLENLNRRFHPPAAGRRD
jgi:hypothetical protein